MSDDGRRNYALPQAAMAFAGLLGVCLVIYAVLWGLDFGLRFDANPWVLFGEPGAVDTLTSFSEVTVGVLGIAITVVAIIVELAANRYTPRITELFVRDPVNIGVMGFFVVTAVVVMWINMSLYGPLHPSAMAMAATALMTASLVAILPYFAYVFDFLTPTSVIRKIQLKGARHIRRLGRVGFRAIDTTRDELMTAVEQLGDIALNSVDKKDKPLTFAGLDALAKLARVHIRNKDQLPDLWFDSSVLVRNDPDFIALHPDMVRALTDRRTWVEMKIFRQYQAVFGDSVNRMRDVNHLIAIHTRRLAIEALDADDRHVLQLALRFQNTYMRAALNARDVRTAYNLMNEYRILAEAALERQETEVVVELAARIKFYGQLAFSSQLAFILESAAYDLCALLETAHQLDTPCHDRLLSIFLDVDREPEGGKAQEESLRGVRKAQIKLATYYLCANALAPAKRIFEDMRSERPSRLRSIRVELEAVKDAEFWEVSDRGINFEFLPHERRETLDTFFGWFDQL